MAPQEQEPDGADAPTREMRRRRHRANGKGRTHDPDGGKYLVVYDRTEKRDIVAAAERAGLRPTSFVAAAALSVAREALPPVPSPMRDAMAELNQLRTLVGRFGTNVNQAVAALNSTGEVPPELVRAVELCARATARADEVVARMQRRLP